MVPVRRVEQAGDSPWIWCVLGGLHLLAKRKTNQRREDCSEYDISSFHDLVFPFFLLLFWPFLISRWRTQFRLFVLPGPKQYPNPKSRFARNADAVSRGKIELFFRGPEKSLKQRLRSPRRPPAWQARMAPLAPQDRAHQSLPHSARERGAKRRDKPGLTMGLPTACKT